MEAFWLGLIVGFVVGMVVCGVGVAIMISNQKAAKATKLGKRMSPPVMGLLLVALLAGVLAFGQVAVSYAQDPTLVPLVIPINPIMTSTNNWMATFAPIAAIGIGITLSLAVLGYLGKMIKSAFT